MRQHPSGGFEFLHERRSGRQLPIGRLQRRPAASASTTARPIQESNIYLDIHKRPAKTACMRPSWACGRTSPTRRLPQVRVLFAVTPHRLEAAQRLLLSTSFHSSNLFSTRSIYRHYVIDTLSTETPIFDSTARLQTTIAPSSMAAIRQLLREFYRCRSPDGGSRRDGSSPADEQRKYGDCVAQSREFFDAPLQTAECLTNLGVTANSWLPLRAATCRPLKRAGAIPAPTTM